MKQFISIALLFAISLLWQLSFLSVATIIITIPGLSLAKETSPSPKNPMDARVQERFLAVYSDLCDEVATGPDIAKVRPDIYQVFFRVEYQDLTQPDLEYRLYEYPCYGGAYNFSSVYFSADEYGEIEQVFFAFPNYEVTYRDKEQTIVEQITLDGFYAWESLTNPGFDQKSMTLYSNNKWRGLADASSSGRWQFKQGRWLLKSFDIDPTYDGKVSMIRIFGKGEPFDNE